MARKTAKGEFIAFGEELRIREGVAKGYFLYRTYEKTYLEYAGMEGAAPLGFLMPSNSNFLRKLASALEKIAEEIDDEAPP